jgi:hypothetical protein
MSRSAVSAFRVADTYSLEQFPFLWSPLGTFATSALLFVFLAGSYAAMAGFVHAPLLLGSAARGWRVEPFAWSALVLSLLAATTLGMQRYARVREQADELAFAAIASPAASAATLLRPASRARMLAASAAGILVGIAVAFATVPASFPREYPALFGWHLAVILFLGALFARGVVMTAQGGRATAWLIDHELRIDLLHVEKLAVIGWRGARTALVWFTCAAVVCLFFAGSGFDGTIVTILAACAVMGLWNFFRPMERVHRRIRAEKSAELDRIRNDIGNVRREAAHDAPAAMRLQGLLAYEARITAVREWPFDQPTLLRVAAYVLIPALPWFGKALTADMIQWMAR